MPKSYYPDQKGTLSLLLLGAAAGILVLLGIATFVPFKDALFTALYPKQASHAAGVVDLSLSPETATVENGKTFLVDVVIDTKTEQPSAMSLKITWSSQILQLVSIEKGSFFTEELVPASIDPSGFVTATYGQKPNQYKTGLGSVATLQFKAISPGASQIIIDAQETQVAAIGKTGNVVGLISNSSVSVNSTSTVEKTAQFSLSPTSGSISSAEFPVQVMVKNETDQANLFSARINYDPAKLEVSRIDTTGSFITQWASGTDSFNNTTGTVSVIGGVQNPGYITGTNPERMATIYFKGKASGTTAVTFDGTSAVYRNFDNVDILQTSTGGNYSVSVITPTPTPTPTPAPSSSVAPTPSPSAIVSPPATSTPTPFPSHSAIPSPSAIASTSPSPIASASVAPGTCSLASAAWITSANPIVEKKIVSLKVTGTGNCVGQIVILKVREDDGVFGTDPTRNDPTSPVKFGSNNEAIGSWMTEFQNDGFNGINNPPEFIFTAQLQGNTSTITSASPSLQVTQAVPGQPVKGDANKDNKFDLADMSVLLTNWSKTLDIEDELDTNDDGVINTFDFAYMLQLLKFEKVIQ